MRGGLSAAQSFLCLLSLSLGFLMNSGCELTTFGNLTTTSSGTGSGSGSTSSSATPHLESISFNVTTIGGSLELNPALVFAGDSQKAKRYTVVWDERPSVGTASPDRISARFLDDNGGLSLSTTRNLRLRSDGETIQNPAAAARGAGRTQTLALWHELSRTGAVSIKSRRVDIDSTNLSLTTTSGVQTVSSDTDLLSLVSVASIPNQDAFLALYYRSQVTNDIRVIARHLNGNGAPSDSAQPVVHQANIQASSQPVLATDGALTTPGFLVVWIEAVAPTNALQIRGEIITVSGQTITVSNTPFTISGETVATRATPHVTFDSLNNHYLVVWTENGTVVAGRRVATDGSLSGSVVSFTTDRIGAINPQASVFRDQAGASRYLLVWQDSNASTPDIRGRTLRVNTSTSEIENAEATLFTIASGTGDQIDPQIAADPFQENWLVLWADRFNGNLRAQRVRPAP